MGRITKNLCYWMLPCIVMTTGCANLRSVNAFSSEAALGLSKYEDLSSGFTKTCEQNCIDGQIRSLKVTPFVCDCKAEVKADSLTRLIYQTTLIYFEELMVLSGAELTELRTTPLTELLSEGSFGPVTLNREQVRAYSQISSTLLGLVSEGYRRGKLKSYVVRSKEPLQVLLEYLDFNLSGNLSKKLEIRKLQYMDFYFDLSRDASLSSYERLKLTEDYYRYVSEIEIIQRQITVYSEALRLLIQGHNELAGQIDELKGPELRKQMFQYAAEIHTLMTGFQSL